MRKSEKRSQSVVQHLTEHGIDKSRLISRGYGKEKPIAPNTFLDGSDNPNGRALNRRTEVKIID